VAMLGAAAATLAVKSGGLVRSGEHGERTERDDDRRRQPWTGTTRWIGHC
jgi:hypothetical protein